MTFVCINEKELETRDLNIIERYVRLFSELKTEKILRLSVFWVIFTLEELSKNLCMKNITGGSYIRD